MDILVDLDMLLLLLRSQVIANVHICSDHRNAGDSAAAGDPAE